MTWPQKRQRPAGTGRVAKQNHSDRDSSTAALPHNWRDRLPDPAKYYASHIAKLTPPNATGWAQGCCPFHEDRNASLSVHLNDPRGSWRCFASCGGGDLLGFHMRKTGRAFKEAVFDLLGQEN